MPSRTVTVPALVLDESPTTSTTGHWFPEVPGVYVVGEAVPVPDGASDEEIAAWIEASGDRLSRTTATVKVDDASKPVGDYSVKELDEKFGDVEGYPVDGKRDEKLAFASSSQVAASVLDAPGGDE